MGIVISEERLAKLAGIGRNAERIAAARRGPHSAPDVESSPRHEPMAAQEAPRPDRPHRVAGPARIVITEYRKRLRDTNNGCDKFIVDALVAAGVLEDDSPDVLPETPVIRQIKAKTEQTVVEVETCI